MQRPRALVAVHVGDLGEPQRQVAVAALLRSVHEDVHRAVHRLHPVAHVLGFALPRGHRRELVVGVQRQVPGAQEQLFTRHVGRVHQLVTALQDHVLDEAPQLEVQHRAFGMPENQPRPDRLLNREQVLLLADDAMVALLRLFEPAQVALEILLAEPRGAVDALQHLAALVAAPICAGGVQQLEVLDAAGARHMGTTAQVHERPVGVNRNDFVLAQVVDALELERVLLEALLGLRARDFFPDEGVIRLHHLHHLFFNRLQVLRREGASHVEVVVEAVLDRRAEADLGLRKDLPHRRGEHVRRRVTQHVERLRMLVGDDLDRDPVGERARQVAHLAVDPRREGGLGQPRADRLGEVGGGAALRQGLLAPVGERDANLGGDHQVSGPGGWGRRQRPPPARCRRARHGCRS